MAGSDQRIANLSLDGASVVYRSRDVEHERAVAIYDLLERNHFAPVSGAVGPFDLHLGIEENRIAFDIRDGAGEEIDCLRLPLGSLRRVIKDYFIVCESYFEAIRRLSPAQIEAIDMGRRGLHNEGSDILRERLADQVKIDDLTARRLFTLICVLHVRG